MRRLALPAIVAMIAIIATGCTTGSGDVVTETRAVEGFDEIDLQGIGEVRVTVTGTESLTIEAEDNILPQLRTDVRNGKLELGTRRPIQPTEDIIYTITAANLEGLEVSGSGSITVSGFETGDLTIDVSGSGAITVDEVTADSVEADISGSGAIGVTGTADSLDLSVSGSGSFNGEDLAVADGEVSVSGSGNAVVNASDTLDVSVSGSGNVEYLGDPSMSVDTSGSGNVSRR